MGKYADQTEQIAPLFKGIWELEAVMNEGCKKEEAYVKVQEAIENPSRFVLKP